MNQQKKLSRKEMRIEFEGKVGRAERLRQRVFTLNFLGKVIWAILRYVLLIGISYIILYPFITKIAASFMSPTDFTDTTVKLISKNPSLDQWVFIIKENKYWQALFNTARISILCGLFQTLICAIIGYGFAKFKFKGRNILFMLVILTMIVPHQTLQLSMFMEFRYFDIFGIVKLLKGGGIELFGHNIKELGPGVAEFFEKLNITSWEKIEMFPYEVVRRNQTVTMYRVSMSVTENGINLCNTYFPMILLSLGGLAFKNGLYIFLLRQFFRGIPDELEESAYMDGSGTMRTFFQIILPLSVPMLITVFLFSFCWQWTDDFYTNLFFVTSDTNMLVKLVGNIPTSLRMDYAGQDLYYSAIRNTCGLMIIFPLVILYAFCQRFLVQGIEQSGLAN